MRTESGDLEPPNHFPLHLAISEASTIKKIVGLPAAVGEYEEVSNILDYKRIQGYIDRVENSVRSYEAGSVFRSCLNKKTRK